MRVRHIIKGVGGRVPIEVRKVNDNMHIRKDATILSLDDPRTREMEVLSTDTEYIDREPMFVLFVA